MERFARLGYASRGLVYAIVAWFAILAANGGERTTDTEGALTTVLQGPFGRIVLGITALGLFAYSAWRLIQALADVDHHGTGAKGIAVRGGLLVSAVVYAGLAVTAAAMVAGFGSGSSGGTGGGSGSNALLDEAVALFGSRPVAIVIALALLGAGIAHFVKAWRHGFAKHLTCDRETMRRITPVAMTGLIARGVVFVILASLMGLRAATADPSAEPPGLDQALSAVRDLPAGSILLVVMGLGLMAYAAYSFLQAAYRHIDVPEPHELARMPGHR